MYAVIETGGKQYRVEVGTELEVELLDVTPGDTVNLERVLLIADGDDASIGRPLVANAAVSAEVLRQDRGDKVISFKYRPKARRRVKKGHRQELTVLRISDIVLDGKSAAGAARKASEDAKTERQRLEEAATKQAAADAALAAKLSVGGDAAAGSAPKASTSKTTASPARAGKPDAKTDTPKANTTKADAETVAETKKTPRAKVTGPAEDAASPDAPKRRQTKKDE
jgi:large subunit ribosomal protein L21